MFPAPIDTACRPGRARWAVFGCARPPLPSLDPPDSGARVVLGSLGYCDRDRQRADSEDAHGCTAGRANVWSFWCAGRQAVGPLCSTYSAPSKYVLPSLEAPRGTSQGAFFSRRALDCPGAIVLGHRGWLDPRTVPVSGRGFVAPAVVTSSRLAVSARHDSNALEYLQSARSRLRECCTTTLRWEDVVHHALAGVQTDLAWVFKYSRPRPH